LVVEAQDRRAQQHQAAILFLTLSYRQVVAQVAVIVVSMAVLVVAVAEALLRPGALATRQAHHLLRVLLVAMALQIHLAQLAVAAVQAV
jgi:hypothetical protein